jgi:hypothetical protein
MLRRMHPSHTTFNTLLMLRCSGTVGPKNGLCRAGKRKIEPLSRSKATECRKVNEGAFGFRKLKASAAK